MSDDWTEENLLRKKNLNGLLKSLKLNTEI